MEKAVDRILCLYETDFTAAPQTHLALEEVGLPGLGQRAV